MIRIDTMGPNGPMSDGGMTAADRRWRLLAILGLALALRLIWTAVIPVEPISDAAAYNAFATTIVEHGVYGMTPATPTAFWAVGTAAIYAGIYWLFGTGSALGIVAINLASSLAAVWLLHDRGRRWYGARAGEIAALLFAIWPLAIQYTTVIASEIHFIALVLAGLALWHRAGRGWSGVATLVLAGVFFAAATYVRPIALLVPAALAVAALLRAPRSAGGPVLKAAVTTALIFAIVAPWSARNERLFGEPVFMSTNFGVTFWMGNHAGTNGAFAHLPPEVVGMSEPARNDYLLALALDDIRADPAGFVTRTIWKALKLHDRETIGVAWNEAALERLGGGTAVMGLKIVSTLYWYAMLALAFWGIAVLARRHGAWSALLSTPVWLWLYFTAIHAIIIIADRYHIPAIPMVALLAAVGLAGLRKKGAGLDVGS